MIDWSSHVSLLNSSLDASSAQDVAKLALPHFKQFGFDEICAFRTDRSGHKQVIMSAGEEPFHEKRAHSYLAGKFGTEPYWSEWQSPHAEKTVLHAPITRDENVVSLKHYRSDFRFKSVFGHQFDDSLVSFCIYTSHELGNTENAGVLARILLPVMKNFARAQDAGKGTENQVAKMEQRLENRFPELTSRERAVCARTLVGMTAEGISIDLEIAKSTVLTYRRRAYSRLNICASNEIFPMLLQ